MQLEVRESAKEELMKISLQEHQGIRISTDVEKGCTLFVDYQLKLDNKTDKDEILISNDIPFLLTPETKAVLPEKLYVSHTEMGFKLSADEGILKANMDLKLK